MKIASCFILLFGALMTSCRGVEPEPAAPHSPTLFGKSRQPARNAPGAGPGAQDLGPVDAKLLQKDPPDAAVAPYTILVDEGDTLELYAKWTGRSIPELLRLNPEAKTTGLVKGSAFVLSLTASEASRFNGSRSAWLTKARERRKHAIDPGDTFQHEVVTGDTIETLAASYGTNRERLQQLNPGLDLSALKPGTRVTVPLTTMSVRPKPSMPGPRPPAPSPVPVPAPPPKPAIVEKSPKASQASGRKIPAMATYVVREGDTAKSLSRTKLKVPLDALRAANPKVDFNRLRPGQKLVVPAKK